MHFEPGKPFNPYMLFHGLFIPNSIAMSYIPDSTKILLGRLMQFAGQDGKAYPTRKRLSEELCWSLSKVARNIRALKELNLIDTKILNEDSATSPNEYVFLYNEMYTTPRVNSDTGVAQDHSTEPTPRVNSDTGPRVNPDTHNIINTIDSSCSYISKEICSPSDRTAGDDQPLEYNGLLCPSCKEPQFITRSGEVCINGHGGMIGIEKEKLTPVTLFPKTLQKIVKTPNPCNYTPDALKIITYWKKCGGQAHHRTTKGNRIDKIKNYIEELLMPGLNTFYLRYTGDQKLKQKQWTVDEIISCIDYYANVLNKPLGDLYFDQFVDRSYFGNSSRSFRNHSPLLDSYRNLPDELTVEWQGKLKNKFKKLYPKVNINSTVLLNCASFLITQFEKYKVTPNGSSYGYHMLNVYVAYMRRLVTESGTKEPLKYMSGEKNLDNFIKYSTTKSFLLKKRSKVA